MAPSKKPKKARKQPPAHRTFRIIGPRPVEEEEESTESDFEPPSPRSLIDNNTNVEPQAEDDQDSVDVSGDEHEQDVSEEEEEDEDEEDEEDEDEEIQVPMKRKQVLKNATKKKTRRIEEEDELSDISIEKEVPKISYTISTFSLEELKKPVTRRKPKSRLIDLSSDLEWVDVKAHLKIAICNQLFPQDAVVEDDRFEMTWCIPRIVTNALSLHTVADYQQLVKKALKAKEPGVKILVDELPKNAPGNEKENVPQPAAAAVAAQGTPNLQAQAPVAPQTKAAVKGKSRARREADILPANVAMNEKFKQLRERWECSMTTCHSEVCFIPAEGPHFALSHDLIEKWAAAILRGPEFATLDTPPNIAAFDSISTHTVVSKSAILQARLNNMAKKEGPQAPVFNVVLPNNFGMYQDFPRAPAPAIQPLQLGPTIMAPAVSTNLIPTNYVEGSKIDLATFCEIYTLADSIKQRLQENAITGSHAFAHMSTTDLQAMGFKLGEVIDLKEAIKEWAQKLV